VEVPNRRDARKQFGNKEKGEKKEAKKGGKLMEVKIEPF
jgi:hypothetical protein